MKCGVDQRMMYLIQTKKKRGKSLIENMDQFYLPLMIATICVILINLDTLLEDKCQTVEFKN